MIGWSSRRYLVPFEPDAPARRFDEILQIASTSAIALYKWKDRGVAPLGRCRSAWLYQGYESSGVATLRHVFVLLFGLGMRESSGRYCEGRDRSVSNTTAG